MGLLALRYHRAGLGERVRSLPEAARCPMSDFARDAALLALAARAEGVTREAYDAAVDAGELVVAHSLRCALHVHARGDEAVFGPPLIGRDERELEAQLGKWSPALDAVAAAIRESLAAGPLTKDELHEAMRQRVGPELLPWCATCRSHHVAPVLWRYAAVKVGTRLDAERRYMLAPAPEIDPREAVSRFLHVHPGASPADFAAWAGVAAAHARRIWVQAPDADAGEPPEPRGVRLLPPGDPFLQRPNRELLVPDPKLRKALFRSAGSPGVVLQDGRVAGMWKVTRAGVAVEPLTRLRRAEVEEEIQRVLAARRPYSPR